MGTTLAEQQQKTADTGRASPKNKKFRKDLADRMSLIHLLVTVRLCSFFACTCSMNQSFTRHFTLSMLQRSSEVQRSSL